MPSRSTICLSWTSAFNVHFLTVIVRFVPGEVHLGYVMTGCVVLCTCILPVVISGGHIFLLVCRIFRFILMGIFYYAYYAPLH